ALTNIIKAEVAIVESVTRLYSYGWREAALFESGDDSFYEQSFYLADPNYFSMFTHRFIYGSAEQALSELNSIVLTEETAEKFFGTINPIGRILTIKNFGPNAFTVSAVIANPPSTSHFSWNMLVPIDCGDKLYWSPFADTWQTSAHTYIKLRKGVTPKEATALISSAYHRVAPDRRFAVSFEMQPLTSIHLHSHLDAEMQPNGSMQNIVLFSILAVVLLTIATVNYVNLATAQAVLRMKEVGIRKTLGAQVNQLVLQFVIESMTLVFLALPFAVLLVELILPFFNSLVQRQMVLMTMDNVILYLICVGIVGIIGLASGLYPAFFISRLHPIKTMKKGNSSGGGTKFRNTLVVFQFTMGITFIFMSIVVVQQMQFMHNRGLGLKKDRIIVLPLKDHESRQKWQLLRDELSKESNVMSAGAVSSLPSNIRYSHGIWYEGADMEKPPKMRQISVDPGFFETFGIKVVKGRGFAEGQQHDARRSYLINEVAARSLGWKEAVGQPFMLSNKGLMKASYVPGQVIGVVEDFHFESLHNSIVPLVININPDEMEFLTFKLAEGSLQTALKSIQARWEQLLPGRPFNYFFFDSQFEKLYQAESQIENAIFFITILLVFIAAMGLFSLAAHSAHRRTKEIGIRKIMGASEVSLIALLCRNMIFLVAIAYALALPLGWTIMHRWLQGFAYQVHLGLKPFLFAGVLTMFIALATVGFHAVRTARANPIKFLHFE
ncbi:ABC transporter permease, partial [bacterium]|nr:ABC transporter permease [bacterium]